MAFLWPGDHAVTRATHARPSMYAYLGECTSIRTGGPFLAKPNAAKSMHRRFQGSIMAGLVFGDELWHLFEKLPGSHQSYDLDYARVQDTHQGTSS